MFCVLVDCYSKALADEKRTFLSQNMKIQCAFNRTRPYWHVAAEPHCGTVSPRRLLCTVNKLLHRSVALTLPCPPQ